MRRSLLGQLVTAAPCQACSGTGESSRRPCETCRGDGRVHGTRTLDVDVPAGIDDGQRLRLAQRGPAAPRGGVPGDLYVSVRVPPRPRRSCGRATISSTARRCRSCRRARHRAHARDASTASSRSKSRPGTQHGALIRLRGLGVPSLRTVAAATSCARSRSRCRATSPTEEAELLAQFAALRGEDGRPAARRAVLAHPLGVPVADRRRPRCDQPQWCAAEDAAAHVFVADPRRRRHDRRAPTAIISSGSAACAWARRVTAADGTGAWRRYVVTGVERRPPASCSASGAGARRARARARRRARRRA